MDPALLNFNDEETKGWVRAPCPPPPTPPHPPHAYKTCGVQFGNLWKGLQFVSILPSLIPWLSRHGDAVTVPLVEEALKEGRTWTTAHGNGRLGAVGFCFGGRYAVLAAGGAEPRVDAYAAVHPSQISVPADVEAVRRPGLFILAESDPRFSGEFRFSAAPLVALESAMLRHGRLKSRCCSTNPGTRNGSTSGICCISGHGAWICHSGRSSH